MNEPRSGRPCHMSADFGSKGASYRPLMILAAVSLVGAVSTSAVLGLTLYTPHRSAAQFTFGHYLFPLVVAAIAGVITAEGRSVLLARVQIIGSMAVIVFVHFNLKLWAQLVNPRLHDDLYSRVDQSLWPVVDGLASASAAMYGLLPSWASAYHDLFVMMFVVSFLVHGFRDRNQQCERLATALGLVLLLGGIAYSIGPAWGPFVYSSGHNPLSAELQARSAAFMETFVASNGTAYDSQMFAASLGAMPSLHLAHASVLTWYAWERRPLFGVVWGGITVFLLCEAIGTRWHYLIDIPPGIFLAIVCVGVSNYWSRRAS